MKILAIDTAEDACSAALLVDGQASGRFEIAPRRHSELILPMMDDLLTEAGLLLGQLDAIAFGRGPGSFTGVRIAAAVAQGAAFAADLPVAPVSTLLALAEGARRTRGTSRVLAALDARMGEVYWSAVDLDAVDGAAAEEHVVPPDRVPLPAGARWTGAGSGWASYRGILEQRLEIVPDAVLPDLRVDALDVAVLGAAACRAGRLVAAEHALPVYLRDEVAWKKKSVSTG